MKDIEIVSKFKHHVMVYTTGSSFKETFDSLHDSFKNEEMCGCILKLCVVNVIRNQFKTVRTHTIRVQYACYLMARNLELHTDRNHV